MNVVLGTKGIKQLRNYFLRQRKLMNGITRVIEKEIAKVGKENMLRNAPTTDVDGNIPGRVIIEDRKDGYAVTYMGADVAYIEFGTGLAGSGTYDDADVIGKVYWEYDVNNHGASGWFYYSKRDGSLQYSRGMRAQKPVYDSYKDTSVVVGDIIRKVLSAKFG